MGNQILGAAIALALALAVGWRWVCHVLRHKRSALLASLHPVKHCHSITLHTICVEFPFLSQKSLEFGLLRTYAIPHISLLLHQSAQLCNHASKRYDDTVILIRELLFHHVDGDRGSLALRRLNFLHSLYPIQNLDYLYVLSIFVLMPMDWAALYGHRPWTEAEKCAYFTIWHDIATRMGIRDIPESLSAFSKFKENYEVQHMIYSDSNKKLADATLGLVLGAMPSFLRPLVRRLAYSLMDDRLLKAVGYPRQPYWLRCLSHGVLKLHGAVLRWLPPRPLSWAVLRIIPGFPKFQGEDFNTDELYKLTFQEYKPATYEQGYRIKEVGSLRPGELGKAFKGQLLCPLAECSNLGWPWELHA